MGFIKRIFGKKDNIVTSYETFWVWFQQHEKNFFDVVKKGNSIEKDFFNRLSLTLGKLNEGFYFLSGMSDDSTAELILTPDGIIKNIIFIEELINAAPVIPGWKFTALKPPSDIENIQITMGDYVFDSESLFFYSNDHDEYPDEIDLVIVHRDYKQEDKSLITNGTYIFIDNFIGELNTITAIDNLIVIDKSAAEKELIPIEKLKPFLIWREKEFIEKYEGGRYDTANDSYSSLEAKLNNDKPLIAKVVNEAIRKHKDLNIDYDIYKDKNWQSFETFRPQFI